MGVTPFELFRWGDAQGAALDYVRDVVDIDTFTKNSVPMVRANNKGASTFSQKGRLPSSKLRWWTLPKGIDFPPELELFNDHRNHWMFVPVREMPRADFVKALAAVNGKFM